MGETASDELQRENPGGVLGVGLGLLLFVLAAVGVATLRARLIEDPGSVWAAHFEPGTAPAGYTFERASELPGERVLVSLVREGAPLEDLALDGQLEESGPTTESDEASLSEGSHVDWTSVEGGAAGSFPERLLFAFYPRGDSQQMFETYFQNLPRKSMEELDSEGGTLIIESGVLDWNGFETNYVHQRRFRVEDDEPGFVDSMRVNLSLGQSCVLLAIWPSDLPATQAVLEELLADVRPGPALSGSD